MLPVNLKQKQKLQKLNYTASTNSGQDASAVKSSNRTNSMTWAPGDYSSKMKYFSSGPFVASPMVKKARKNVLSPQPTNLSDLLALASIGHESPSINDRSDRSINDINSPSGKGSSMRADESNMS